MTFERKVAVTYLAHLLAGTGAAELGDERRVLSVAFQQAPNHPVDDLLIAAARPGESEPSFLLAIGARRAPNLVNSDESTQKLVRDFVRGVLKAPVQGLEQRFALVVAGHQEQAKQLATLADHATVQADAPAFFDLIRTPNKFAGDIRGRLDQIEALVRRAIRDIEGNDPESVRVQQSTWELLSRLAVLMPRLESPDESDWTALLTSLISVSRGRDLAGASRLRDRLLALANEYPQKAATVDLTVLRRGVHAAIDSTIGRNQQGWSALDHLNDRALSSIQDRIAAGDGARHLHLARGDIAAQIIESATSARAVVVSGESGAGKSALVLRAAVNADDVQILRVNLRHLPRTTLEFESLLGCSLRTLFAEMSAPRRILIVDAADAVAEGMLDQFRYLVDEADSEDVSIIAVTAADTKQVIWDTLTERIGKGVIEHIVPVLTDTQIDEVVATFGELANLATNQRSRELLRRPVVIDLLVRGGLSGVPVSESDAMLQVWLGLVRRREQSDRGTPDARDVAMLRLADLSLAGGVRLDVVGAIDPTALDGLRRDGLLRTPITDPFAIGPEFAHDEVRRYAVARLLLAESDLTAKLIKGAVPRWALGAARLACQARLCAPDASTNPLRGRYARLQASFDALVSAGHGERWGDVPGEALLTLGDPEPLLRDAWSALRADNDNGLRRLGRLIDQRLRTQDDVVRVEAVEPVVALLLDNDAPWRSGEYVHKILRDWLRALVLANTPAGYPLRERLRSRLVAMCAAADRQLEEARVAAAAAHAARTPEEIEKERQFLEHNQALFTEIGYPRRRRRERAEVPTDIKSKIVVELLALLGPDLGAEGEVILRRVGRDAPSWLAPAVEEFLTGRALASYRRGFLAELTQSYYLDDEEDGSGIHEDGIRDHRSRAFGPTPLAAWYRGPFMSLFQTDFRNGVAILNRMLNHAALSRVRTLAGLHRGYGAPIDEADVERYRTELDITGTRRSYIGDDHVWKWYRGTGVGPYPCMSALQALERVCDQLIDSGAPLSRVVTILLHGCDNLAMIGLIVGLLVRHMQRADRLLDAYLAEPMVWHLEFSRAASESGGLAAKSDGIVAPDRRTWSMREAAAQLMVTAEDERASELRVVGEQLVDNARRLIGARSADTISVEVPAAQIEEHLAVVRAWASGLDRSTYQVSRTDAGLYIQSHPPEDVVQALQRGNEDLRRREEATRLFVRYHIHARKRTATEPSPQDMAADLAVARDLLENPPTMSVGGRWEVPTAVAATAISAHLLRGVPFTRELLVFAADTILQAGTSASETREFEIEDSYYEQGADRWAARILPLMLLPAARAMLVLVDGNDGSAAYQRVAATGAVLATATEHEVRLHLARGFDPAWDTPCSSGGECHHLIGLKLMLQSMRACGFGDWDPATGERPIVLLDDPIEASLATTPDDAIYFSRLDAAIRALAPASVAGICVSARARAVLDVALAAQRRSLLAYEHDMDSRGTHALVSARAVLTLACDGDDRAIFDHINGLAANATLLGSFLRALSGAAEESVSRADTARRLWPTIIMRVLELKKSGQTLIDDDSYFGGMTIAALLPNTAGEVSFLYPERDGDPIVWWRPLEWRDAVERWLPVAAGSPSCVDHLISFLSSLSRDDQARLGLPWVSALVLPEPEAVAQSSFLLSTWLIETRAAATDQGLVAVWQRVVDALVVAGVSRLAPYSE